MIPPARLLGLTDIILSTRSPHSQPDCYGASRTDEIVLFWPYQSVNVAYVPSLFGPPVLLTTQLPPS